jgi:cold-inducible RNA-binding protein
MSKFDGPLPASPGRSRGFGFVTFATRDDADYAITKTDNQELQGRSIRVNVSRGRDAGGGGGGGFRGGGGGGGDR